MNEILYNILKDLTKTKKVECYSRVAESIGFSMERGDQQTIFFRFLDEISRHEHTHKRPMLSAVVIHKNGDKMPGPGFFKLARELDLLRNKNKDAEMDFWASEVGKVHDYWSRPATSQTAL